MLERTRSVEVKRGELPVVKGFFALESLDGVGKSTTIAGLKEKGFVVHKTPPEEIADQRVMYDQAPLRDRFSYYMRGVALVGQQARLLAGNTQFSDRFLLTTVSAHEAMGLSPNHIRETVYNGLGVQLPEKTILLTASDEVRMQRLMSRGANDNDIANLKISDKIVEGFKSWASELNHPIVEIDTSNMTPDEVVQAVIDIT